jgi:rhodanese-related sulfurtransferase
MTDGPRKMLDISLSNEMNRVVDRTRHVTNVRFRLTSVARRDPPGLWCERFEVSRHESTPWSKGGNVDVVDVRERVEWNGGHIPGARHVPLESLRADPTLLKRDGIVFVCAAGVRSQTAARIAEGLGYGTLYNLSGGTRAWAKAGLPLERAASAA